MVEVEHNLRMLAAELLGILYSTLGEVAEDGAVSIVTGTLGNLHDNGRLCLDGSHDDGLHLLHGVEVESGDSIATGYGSLEHLAGINETQILVIYHNLFVFKMSNFVLNDGKVTK